MTSSQYSACVTKSPLPPTHWRANLIHCFLFKFLSAIEWTAGLANWRVFCCIFADWLLEVKMNQRETQQCLLSSGKQNHTFLISHLDQSQKGLSARQKHWNQIWGIESCFSVTYLCGKLWGRWTWQAKKGRIKVSFCLHFGMPECTHCDDFVVLQGTLSNRRIISLTSVSGTMLNLIPFLHLFFLHEHPLKRNYKWVNTSSFVEFWMSDFFGPWSPIFLCTSNTELSTFIWEGSKHI